MNFRIVGLDPAAFRSLHAISDEALIARGVQRVRVEAKFATPCRVSLDDAEIGEPVLLLNHVHQPADTPYHQQGPIYVRDTEARYEAVGLTPPALARRPLSLRGFDRRHMMIDADLVDGAGAAALITRMFENPDVQYIHAHYAKRGCFAAAITRA